MNTADFRIFSPDVPAPVTVNATDPDHARSIFRRKFNKARITKTKRVKT